MKQEPWQPSFLDEIIVDSFTGGGGASTGIELATGRTVAIAINHDPDAILMHKTNHPYTEHYQASVWDIDPREVCKGRPVGLAWFSPDCKHFSKAKGAALVDKHIRGLAWIVLRWAALVRPRVIMLENVEEFVTWGPVRNGKPVKKKAGQTFAKWKQQLTDLGYVIEHRELVAADYGAPTSRKRFVLVARCDGEPIRWPERTHAPADSEEVKSGKCLPWRCAAEIIDWTLPCPSVFASKEEIMRDYGLRSQRPLKPNTMRRIIRGVDKFTIRSGKPFLVECNHSGGGHVWSAEEPYRTIEAKHTGGTVSPLLSPITFPNTNASVGSPANEPCHTVTSAGNQVLSAANLIQYRTEQSENVRANGVEAPLPTVDGSNRYGLTTANLVAIGQTSGGNRVRGADEPIHTVVSKQEECLTSAHLTEYYGNGNPISISEPMHTATSHDREALTAVHVQKYFSGVVGESAEEPLPTVTSVDHNSICAAHVAQFKGQCKGQSVRDPLFTVTAGNGEFGEVRSRIERYAAGADLGHWPEIRDLLNEYCGYDLKDDEIILLQIGGVWYYIADIGLRMLTPRELYNAMGFPPDYVIDRDYMGNDYGKSKQVARCGNAVCPPMAEAVVRANLPEWCNQKITTMRDLNDAIAV